ncbi:MAG: hypothetical protein R3F62_24795 [Planctomycetota bacterium]
MSDLWTLAAIVGWLLLQLVILPRFGVKTWGTRPRPPAEPPATPPASRRGVNAQGWISRALCG